MKEKREDKKKKEDDDYSLRFALLLLSNRISRILETKSIPYEASEDL